MSMFEDHQRRRIHDAIDDLERALGITGHVGPGYRYIVISDTDHQVLVDWAVDEGWKRDHAQPDSIFAGIPLVTAPDWTCDPGAVAWLRFRTIATQRVARLLRRRIRR